MPGGKLRREITRGAALAFGGHHSAEDDCLTRLFNRYKYTFLLEPPRDASGERLVGQHTLLRPPAGDLAAWDTALVCNSGATPWPALQRAAAYWISRRPPSSSPSGYRRLARAAAVPSQT